MSNRERLKWFNKLRKTCGRLGATPKSKRTPDRLKDLMEVECGVCHHRVRMKDVR